MYRHGQLGTGAAQGQRLPATHGIGRQVEAVGVITQPGGDRGARWSFALDAARQIEPFTLAAQTLFVPELASRGLGVDQAADGGGNALILGSSASETLSGGGGDDCIVAGAGSDTLNGQGGNDVLISGPGFIDFLNGGGGNDTCYGAGFLNWPTSCETYYP